MKKTLEPKTTVHLSIDSELKAYAIKQNMNLSDLLETEIKEYMKIETAIDNERDQILEAIESQEKERYLRVPPFARENKAYGISWRNKAVHQLRKEYGLKFEDAYELVKRAIK